MKDDVCYFRGICWLPKKVWQKVIHPGVKVWKRTGLA